MRRADLTTFMRQLSGNLGASASWNPQGLFRPVQGLLYLLLYINEKGREVVSWIKVTRQDAVSSSCEQRKEL